MVLCGQWPNFQWVYVQWFELIQEYAAPYKYQVAPDYYEDNELTDLQAEALGFHALARELKDFYA